MKKTKLTILITLFTLSFYAQNNSSEKQLLSLQTLVSGLSIGGYGEMTYNNPDSGSSELDVQRLVILFAYKFDDRVSFFAEIEFEHVKEVYVEQAFLNYGVSDNFSIKGGLLLVPMGIINEYHEPTTYNGVERPSLNNKLVPTTW